MFFRLEENRLNPQVGGLALDKNMRYDSAE